MFKFKYTIRKQKPSLDGLDSRIQMKKERDSKLENRRQLSNLKKRGKNIGEKTKKALSTSRIITKKKPQFSIISAPENRKSVVLKTYLKNNGLISPKFRETCAPMDSSCLGQKWYQQNS